MFERMKTSNYFILLILLIASCQKKQQIREISIINWEFREQGADWLPAKVPGFVHLDLYDNDLIEDRLFPKYRVYKGYLILDAKNINKDKDKDKFIDDYLINKNIDFVNRIYLFLKSYSFSSNILNNAFTPHAFWGNMIECVFQL